MAVNLVADWNWKRHDTAGAIPGIIENSAGAAIDITGSTVKFIMVAADANGAPVVGTPKVSASATIVSGPAGTVSYAPISVDTDTAGWFLAEWEVTYPSTKKETFPKTNYVVILITADLDNA